MNTSIHNKCIYALDKSLDSKLNACFFLAYKKHTENTKLTIILTLQIQFELNTPYILVVLFYSGTILFFLS